MGAARYTIRVEVGSTQAEASSVVETERPWETLSDTEIKTVLDKAYRSLLKTVLEHRNKK